MLTRRALAAVGWMSCLILGAADCSDRQVDYDLGYAEVGGKTAVYAPVCAGDAVHAVRVYAAPPPEQDGDFVLLWQASVAANQSTKDGLIVLGEGFTTVETQAPQQFPVRLSVSVETVEGRGMSQAREHAADLPRYPAGTPASQMSFDTGHGRLSFNELRKLPNTCS